MINSIDKVERTSLILSSIAIGISIITICLTLPRTEISIDYLGLITGILEVLVSVQMGYFKIKQTT